MKTLYTKDNKGKIRVWNIYRTGDFITIEHGQLGGHLQVKREEVLYGKAGRSQTEQIELQINSRVSKQLDKGYIFDLSVAMDRKATNAAGFLKPMLAHSYEDYDIDFKNCAYVQRKLDGNRCIITNHDGNVIAYTRNGKPITSIGHILNNLDIPVGATLDGELYIHGERLQNIASLIKKEQEESQLLKFHAYDIMSPKSFSHRLDELMKVCAKNNVIELVETRFVSNETEIKDYYNLFVAEGYEGAIIRHTDAGYEDGKRSRSLLKMKGWQDEEFRVIDITASKDGWAILHCAQGFGLPPFKVTAPGTMDDKYYVFNNKEKYINRLITIEFAYRTEDGSLFHPVAKNWR